jgi:hypothetical protein
MYTFDLKIFEMINTLQSKGNRPTLIEMSRQVNDEFIKKPSYHYARIKYLTELMDIPVQINPNLKGNVVLITYKGRIGGILDSIRVVEE